MRYLRRDAFRDWFTALLHVNDTPRRTAAAYAVGVFFGFSPLLGLHTVLGLACAFAMNLNRVAVLLGVYSNLPWIIAPYYMLATAGGATLMGVTSPELDQQLGLLLRYSPFDAEFWRRFVVLRPLLWPYLVGSTIGALLLSGAAYRLALAFLLARRRDWTEPNCA